MRLNFGLNRPLTIDYSNESSWIESIVIKPKTRKKVFIEVNLQNAGEYTKVVRKKDVQAFLNMADVDSVGVAICQKIWSTF
jgi:hypothetical protein